MWRLPVPFSSDLPCDLRGISLRVGQKIRLKMTFNKKQKKQIDVERKKLQQLQQQLSGARRQMDDPEELTRLQAELTACENRLKKLQES